jgi:lipoprotein-anchoring transpeptidase ErfK/SrfK
MDSRFRFFVAVIAAFALSLGLVLLSGTPLAGVHPESPIPVSADAEPSPCPETASPDLASADSPAASVDILVLPESSDPALPASSADSPAFPDAPGPDPALASPDTVPSPDRPETWIRIDKSDLRLYLMEDLRILKSWPVAIGKGPGKGRTPEGTFRVLGIYDSTDWVFDPAKFGLKGEKKKGVYGPRFIRLQRPPGVGIHGTLNPAAIGHRVTLGCIRMKNPAVLELAGIARKGMRVRIDP